MKQWQAFSEEVIEALLEDGSNEEAMHSIEHHFSGDNFKQLEAAAVVAFNRGYDVTDAEQFETEDGELVLGFDVIIESPLELESILADVEQMLDLAPFSDSDFVCEPS